MKTLIAALFACLTAAAQPPQLVSDTPALKLPTYVGAGVSCNQIAVPPCNPWLTSIYPASSSLGIYLSSTADITPVQQIDPTTKRTYWAFTTSIRQGAHKLLLTSGRFSILVGGDAGGAFSQSATSGIGVSFTGSITATAVWQISNKWAVIAPIRAVWINSGWNAVPQVGILFKP
jgi:hypothetical protein